MHTMGMVLGVCGTLLQGLLFLKVTTNGLNKVLPFFYSYLIYLVFGDIVLYAIYGLFPLTYPPVYWFGFLITILVEFAVLVEISDQIFRPFPAIRNLGRALTILTSACLGLFYMLPTALRSGSRSKALIDFTLSSSVTKAIVLLILIYVAKHFGCLGQKDCGLDAGLYHLSGHEHRHHGGCQGVWTRAVS